MKYDTSGVSYKDWLNDNKLGIYCERFGVLYFVNVRHMSNVLIATHTKNTQNVMPKYKKMEIRTLRRTITHSL